MQGKHRLLVGEVNPEAGRGSEIHGGQIWEGSGNRVGQVDVGIQGQGCLRFPVCG